MYSSSTAANGSGSSSGARPRRRRGRAVVFSEADPASWPPRFCAFSVATPGVYFREGYLCLPRLRVSTTSMTGSFGVRGGRYVHHVDDVNDVSLGEDSAGRTAFVPTPAAPLGSSRTCQRQRSPVLAARLHNAVNITPLL